MLNDATDFDKIYIATGLSSEYFYPHLFLDIEIFTLFFAKKMRITLFEQNRCAMACQGCGAVFTLKYKKQW